MLREHVRFLLCCLGLSGVGNAAASYYCADTKRVVNEGDSMVLVHAFCGNPTYVRRSEERISAPMEITQWVYMPHRPAILSQTSDYLARLIIVFNNQGKVITLRQSQLQDVEGHPNQPSIAPCGAMSTVKLGDDLSAVEFACGQPTFINKLQSFQEVVKSVVEWQYQPPTHVSPTVLHFEDGILTKIIGQS